MSTPSDQMVDFAGQAVSLLRKLCREQNYAENNIVMQS